MLCLSVVVVLHVSAASEPSALVERSPTDQRQAVGHRDEADMIPQVGRQLIASKKHHRWKARRRTGRRGAFLLPRAKMASNGMPLLRFAIFGDTHFWSASPARTGWQKRVAAQAVRDGLIVDEVDSILPKLLQQLSTFAASGADFAVHTGDAVCGGSTFGLTPAEFTQSLVHYRALEVSALGSWPVLHIPGNHDLDPNPDWPRRGGTGSWRGAMCANTTRPLSRLTCSTGSPNYSSIRAAGWRVVLLDAQDGLTQDSDGRGLIGAAQLDWLRSELEDAALAGEQVILVMHQLLVDPSAGQPTDGSTHRGQTGDGPPGGSWIESTQDFILNRAEVLSLLSNFDNVRLSLHGHVHANSIVTRRGVAFVTTASPIEFPMHWREVTVHECELRLTTHAIDVPRQRDKSRQADRRGGRNGFKLGPAAANSVVIRTCDPV